MLRTVGDRRSARPRPASETRRCRSWCPARARRRSRPRRAGCGSSSKRGAELDPFAVAASLALGRAQLPHRAVALAPGLERAGRAAAARSSAARRSRAWCEAWLGARRGVGFVFPGQGGQWPGMAVELMDASPVFAEHMRACDEALAPHVDFELEDVLRGEPGAADPRARRGGPAGAVRGDGLAGPAVALVRGRAGRGGRATPRARSPPPTSPAASRSRTPP